MHMYVYVYIGFLIVLFTRIRVVTIRKQKIAPPPPAVPTM